MRNQIELFEIDRFSNLSDKNENQISKSKNQIFKNHSLVGTLFQLVKQKIQIKLVSQISPSSNEFADIIPNKNYISLPKNQRQAQQRRQDQKANQFQQKDEHKIPEEQLYFRFDTDKKNGLTTDKAVMRNIQQGDNKLPQKKKTPRWIRFLKQITNWFAILLWISSILCILTYALDKQKNQPNLYLACVLVFVIILTGIITFAQGAKSEVMMQGFKNMLPEKSQVYRDGAITQIESSKLVRGDIVELKGGNKIPADIRILDSIDMTIDSSKLTGEVQPLLKSNLCTHPNEYLQTRNMVFFGTVCREGKGKGIVVAIGSKTVMSEIADLVVTAGMQKTPLKIELDRFILILTIITISLGIVFFLSAYFAVRYDILKCLIFGIGIIVANVPEGLLACITISLAITAKKLSEKHVLVKNLQAVETLGSTSCICSDKTGTLTQNRMTVQNLYYDGISHQGHNQEINGPYFAYQYDVKSVSFQILHKTAIICSQAVFNIFEKEKQEPQFAYFDSNVLGDASEAALIKFFQPIEDIIQTRKKYSLGYNIDNSDSKMPFNSINKYSLTIVRQKCENHQYMIYIKGAPQKILSYCDRVLFDGQIKQMNDDELKKIEAVNIKYGKNGERVLGFARLPLNKQIYDRNFKFNTSSPQNFNFTTQNFIFIGLISLMDPPKQSVPLAIKKCQSAGIKVIMVTGDQLTTAVAIARQIGIITMKTNQDYKEQGFSPQVAIQKANSIIIHGDMILKAFQNNEQVGEKKLKEWLRKPQIIFTRTTPSQKLQIVKANQSLGEVVGVTGDGINDSPAIKQADIGISMGISGSDLTKDAADMILLNDDFSSILDGIQQGRKIFDNLKKTIVYLLTSNMAQIWPFIALIVLKIPLPLSSLFILCICIGTDIYPAISLAYESAQVDIMTRKPRRQNQHLVSTRLLCHAYGQMGQITIAGGMFSYFIVMELYGFPYSVLIGLLTKQGVHPVDGPSFNEAYIYNSSKYSSGSPHTPSNCQDSTRDNNFPQWFLETNNKYDLRGAYVKCCENNPTKYCPIFTQWNKVKALETVSSITGQKIAFTTQAMFYAQSAYFVTVVLMQWSNLFACKCRKTSFRYSKINKHMFIGILIQTVLFIVLLYIPGLNKVFGGRPLEFFLLGIPGLGFSMLLLIWQQTRKFLINMKSNNGQPNWWQKNLVW